MKVFRKEVNVRRWPDTDLFRSSSFITRDARRTVRHKKKQRHTRKSTLYIRQNNTDINMTEAKEIVR